MSLTVESDISSSVDLLGKIVTDLQEDIEVGTDAITGTLKSVSGYTGFSGDVSEQSGHYLALHCEATEGATITVELIGGTHGPVNLDEDGLIIFRIAATTQKVKVTAAKTGYNSVTRTYELTDIVLGE